jgi:hypothetical protein
MNTIKNTISTIKPFSLTTKKTKTTKKLNEEYDFEDESKNDENKKEYDLSYETEYTKINNNHDSTSFAPETDSTLTNEYKIDTDSSDSSSYSLETEMSTNSEGLTISPTDSDTIFLFSEEASNMATDLTTTTSLDETELFLYSTEISTLLASTPKTTLIQTKPTKVKNTLTTTNSKKSSSIPYNTILSSTKYSSIYKIFETSPSTKPTTNTKKITKLDGLINECSKMYENFCLNQGECYLKTYQQDLSSLINNTKPIIPIPNCKCRHYTIFYGLILINYYGQRCEIMTYSFTYLSLGISFIGIIIFILLIIFILIMFKIIFSKKSSQNIFSVEYRNKVYRPDESSTNLKKLDDIDWSKKFRTIRNSWKFIRFTKNSKNNRLNKNKIKKNNEIINSISKKLFIKDNIMKNYFRKNIKDANIFDLNENFIFVDRNKSNSHLFGSGSNFSLDSVASSLNKLDAKHSSNIFIYPKPSRLSNMNFFKSEADWW